MKYEDLKLTNINNGVIEDLFNEELHKVLKNINDLNVEPDAIREINIKIKIKPSKDRLAAATLVQVTSRLASTAPVGGSIFFSFMGNQPKAFANNQKQMTIEDFSGNEKE